MTQRIEFIIRGEIASDHRRIESWFDKKKQRRAKPIVFRPKSYEQFRERVKKALAGAKREQGWIVPEKGVAMKLYVEFHLATHKIIKPKKHFDKNGRRLSEYLSLRNRPDHDNCEKCLKDALQKDRPKKIGGALIQDPRFLYVDDKFVDCYPFPGREWFVIEPGTEEWVVVALEVVGESHDHVTQASLDLSSSSRPTRKSAVAQGSARVEEEF